MVNIRCWTLPLLTTLTLMSCYREGTGVNLTVPSSITIGGQNGGSGQLIATCGITKSGTIKSIQLGKIYENNTKSPILEVTPSGSISSLKFQVAQSDLHCTDAGRYYCRVIYVTRNVFIWIAKREFTAEIDFGNVTAKSFPENIKMDVYPDKSEYTVGDLVEFKCSGLIGNQFNADNMTSYWTWQWRSVNSSTFEWTAYPNVDNITYDIPVGATDCQYEGSSRLFHTMTSLDNGQQFRCIVLSNPDYGDNITVYTSSGIMESNDSVSCSGSEDCQNPPKDLFCTAYTYNSVTLQWVYNDTKCSSLRFNLEYRDVKGTGIWKPVNTTDLNVQLQTLHTVRVPQLPSDSLIYFRLYFEVDEKEQCEAVTTTCFTSDEPIKCFNSNSLGIGIGVDISVMLLCGGLGLVIAFIYRKRAAQGGLTDKTPETNNHPQMPTAPSAETEIKQTTGEVYEMPCNFDVGLHRRSEDVHTIYEELATYQNT